MRDCSAPITNRTRFLVGTTTVTNGRWLLFICPRTPYLDPQTGAGHKANRRRWISASVPAGLQKSLLTITNVHSPDHEKCRGIGRCPGAFVLLEKRQVPPAAVPVLAPATEQETDAV
jgi:hypothetical protein